MVIVGLNATGYNTACALLVDGELVYAVEEERIIREKRTRNFPIQGLRAALDYASISLDDVDVIAIGWNPAVNLETFSPPQVQRNRYLGEILYNVPSHLIQAKSGNAVARSSQSIRFLDGADLEIEYVTHHRAHAASFYFSPFEEAAILTADAFGEKQCTTFSVGQGSQIEELWDQEFPQALGSLYACFTEYCGFKPQSDEWKLMGASSFGNPKRFSKHLGELVDLREDGGFELDLRFFNHYQFHRPHHYTPRLAELLGIPPNQRDEPLTEVYYDLAAGAQHLFEEIYFHMLRALHAQVGTDNVVIAGGTALNSLANGKIREQTPFKDCFIPPTPDDSGCSVGAAFHVNHQLLGASRRYVMTSNYLGPGYSGDEIRNELDRYKIPYETINDPPQRAAELIADGKIIGWFQGRLEFGDRALGNRSILADPRDAAMKDKVNATVKYREPFRPFAPSIMADFVNDYFVGAYPTPFMEKVFPICEHRRKQIPAVTHVDGTGRLQTVTPEENNLYYDLIRAFYALTGVPLVLNTSFNLKGEAVVCAPRDAIRTFYSSGLDALIMGNSLICKNNMVREGASA